jgi:carbon-monoxide dehydrogenase large subunit
VGDAVAVVIAETVGKARDAAEKVKVEYEVLPAVTDPAKAKSGAQIHEVAPKNTIYEWSLGDAKAVEAAFASATHVTTLDIVNNRLIPNAIEPRASLAEYDPGTDHLTLWNTSQNPHVARLVIAAFVGIAPEHKLRVIAPDVGGGFGSKIFIYPEEVVCLWAARKVRRPVKWTAERSESFLTDAHGRDHVTKAELALDEHGKILALRAHTIANLGAYMSTFSSSVPTYLYATLLSGQYDIPQIYCEVDAVYTNTASVDAYRGAGRPEAAFVVERLVEVAAREMGIDPADLRKRNFIKSFPHQTPVIMNYDSGDYGASLKKAMELADVKGFNKRKREAARHGKLRGLGYSAYIEACGIAPSQAVGSLGAGVGLWESAEVRVNPTGSVEVLTGTHAHGQGHETTFAQLVSERLGIPFENVSIVHGDTDKVQFGMGTYGSRSGAVGMSAVVKALDKVEAKAKKVAAHMLEAAEGDIEFKDGKFTVAGTDKSAAWGDVALNAYIAHKFSGQELEPGLKETSFYDPTNFTFPAGCHICEVEVDADTGKTDIVNWTAVDDFGTVINPMIVEGQVHGGIAQGVGQALLEGAIYDKDGQLVTGSLMDYTMPRAHDLPSFKVETTETKAPSNPLGIKGCGEAGAIAAPAAVINAITDAIGSEALSMPATANAVWSALQRAKPRAAA